MCVSRSAKCVGGARFAAVYSDRHVPLRAGDPWSRSRPFSVPFWVFCIFVASLHIVRYGSPSRFRDGVELSLYMSRVVCISAGGL